MGLHLDSTLTVQTKRRYMATMPQNTESVRAKYAVLTNSWLSWHSLGNQGAHYLKSCQQRPVGITCLESVPIEEGGLAVVFRRRAQLLAIASCRSSPSRSPLHKAVERCRERWSERRPTRRIHMMLRSPSIVMYGAQGRDGTLICPKDFGAPRNRTHVAVDDAEPTDPRSRT